MGLFAGIKFNKNDDFYEKFSQETEAKVKRFWRCDGPFISFFESRQAPEYSVKYLSQAQDSHLANFILFLLDDPEGSGENQIAQGVILLLGNLAMKTKPFKVGRFAMI